MTCGHCVGAGRIFGERRARAELRRLRRRGPRGSTGRLIDLLAAEGVGGARVLDIGAGVGGVHLSLLGAGASEALHVDASAAYQSASRGEAVRRGLADRVRYVAGDYLDVAAGLPPADVVCLDRVVCCYPDMPALVSRSAAAAGRTWGVVFPVDRFWSRALMGLGNLWFRITGNAFRAFVHPEEAIRRTAEAAGLALARTDRVGMWRVQIFRRDSVSQARPTDRSSV